MSASLTLRVEINHTVFSSRDHHLLAVSLSPHPAELVLMIVFGFFLVLVFIRKNAMRIATSKN